MNKITKEYIDEGNAIQVTTGIYSTQDTLYRNRLTLDQLTEYIIKEHNE